MKNIKKEKKFEFKGLSFDEIIKSRELYGQNKLGETKKESTFSKIISIFKEPMFLLLLIAASVYFIVGEYADGIVMLVFVLGICFIEFFQETKTEHALEELKKLSSVNVKVIRNSEKIIITSEELVVDDIVILEEGDIVPADGKIVYNQGLVVNESILTGEFFSVYKCVKEDKDNHFKKNICYSGTSITNGMGIIEIIAVGENTEVGKIGLSINKIQDMKSPLEKQVNKLVYVCTLISLIVFAFTIIINFINTPELEFSKRIVEALLSGITIAMATIPEEIPVILTVFLAMGAWDLSKEKALTKTVKKLKP